MVLFFKHQIKTYFIWMTVLAVVSCDNENVADGIGDEVGEEAQEIIPLQDRLPQVVVNTRGGTIVDEPKISSDAVLLVAGDTVYNGNLGIEFRGASSQTIFLKKSYGLETWDENDEDINVSLFGLPKEKDRILNITYSDKALMRNILIYDLSRDIGQYASRSLFVDLTINENYQGFYVFMEKLKRDGNRIDISKPNYNENTEEDLTGGYILKIDKTAGNNLGEGYNELNSFVSAYDPLGASREQQTYFYRNIQMQRILPRSKKPISQHVY